MGYGFPIWTARTDWTIPTATLQIHPPSRRPSSSTFPTMASKAASKRLNKEYIAMQTEPPPFIWAVPDEKNILTWNFLIRGPPDSPFAGGEYHGVLLFPSEYPFKPPGIKMFTPSGRFQPDKKICFSMSDFHPGSWNPAWSVATILTGLLSFMLSDEMTTGSVTSSNAHKSTYAARSHPWNLTQTRFKEAFPDYCTPQLTDLPNMGERERGRPSTPTVAPTTVTPTPAPVPTAPAPPPQPAQNPLPAIVAASPSSRKAEDNAAAAVGWASGWGTLFWQKWRWGILIALAVIVSKISSKD